METFSPLLALCVGNSPVSGKFPSQRPVTRSFDVFFDLHLNKRVDQTIETPVISDVIALITTSLSGLILGLRPANERRRYKVTPSLIGWVQTYKMSPAL